MPIDRRPSWPTRLRRRAFTLVEMLITISVMALVAATVAPMFTDDGRLRVMGAADLIRSDIEAAQVMNIAFPSDPVVVRFNAGKNTYWLAYAADTETPIGRPHSGEPYLMELGKGRASAAVDVTFTLDQVTDDTIAFDSAGGLVDFSVTPRVQIGSDDNAITLFIAPMTGTIKEFDGTIAEMDSQ